MRAAGRNNDHTKLARVVSTKLSIEYTMNYRQSQIEPTEIKESINPPYLSFYDL
jgi:hypothetical protein